MGGSCRDVSDRGWRYSRRNVLEIAVGLSVVTSVRGVRAQSRTASTPRTVQTPALTIGFEESGNPQGFPVILLHGFPDDARAWDRVATPLVADGYRVIVPFLRGYGPTRVRDARVRMGEQAAIGQDLIDLADALGIDRFAACGYDWGGRAACIAAALHRERVRATVIIGGYSIQDTLSPPQPAPPDRERALWYQWYFNTERGRLGLDANRRSLCRLLWQTWSPTWKFTDEEYNTTAASFDNPDFVDVVIHSYRHRNKNAPGEPRFEETERRLAQRPKIDVPSIVLYGTDDGVAGPPAASSAADQMNFTALIDRRIVSGAGHFMPREKPEAVSSALLHVLRLTK
jgi:pimeloyl-ACP methyl ester carboxylesterase